MLVKICNLKRTALDYALAKVLGYKVHFANNTTYPKMLCTGAHPTSSSVFWSPSFDTGIASNYLTAYKVSTLYEGADAPVKGQKWFEDAYWFAFTLVALTKAGGDIDSVKGQYGCSPQEAGLRAIIADYCEEDSVEVPDFLT